MTRTTLIVWVGKRAPSGALVETTGLAGCLASWLRGPIRVWRQTVRQQPTRRFDTEDVMGSGSQAVVRWAYRQMRNGGPWRPRGVDVFTMRDGTVAAMLAYVKG